MSQLAICIKDINITYYLAAREHFALAMRVASQEYQQNLFMNLLEFDGDDQIPYQFRGVHVL
ncbi:MAG: hypothetical protein RLO18_00130, partial [Gimesia chilikensis]